MFGLHPDLTSELPHLDPVGYMVRLYGFPTLHLGRPFLPGLHTCFMVYLGPNGSVFTFTIASLRLFSLLFTYLSYMEISTPTHVYTHVS